MLSSDFLYSLKILFFLKQEIDMYKKLFQLQKPYEVYHIYVKILIFLVEDKIWLGRWDDIHLVVELSSKVRKKLPRLKF